MPNTRTPNGRLPPEIGLRLYEGTSFTVFKESARLAPERGALPRAPRRSRGRLAEKGSSALLSTPQRAVARVRVRARPYAA
jgi:hypothetical protein